MNSLYFGDNLDILRRYVGDESVDLIYLDPPFNSKATYNILFNEKNGTDSAAQITAFDDFWHWDMAAEARFYNLPGLLPEVPRLQILTVEQLLAGKKLDYPVSRGGTFQKAPRQFKGKRKRGSSEDLHNIAAEARTRREGYRPTA